MKTKLLSLIRKIPKGPIRGFLSVINTIVRKLSWFSTRLNMNTLQRPEVKTWDAAHGDETLRLDYKLKDSSIVFDVGGFTGEWCSQIFLRYMPTIYVFEPVKEAVKILRKKFTHNPKVHIIESALGNRNGTAQISLESQAASLFSTNNTAASEQINLISVSDFMEQHAITHIDLMKINIEGGEYDLLEHILEKNLITRIDNIQVQFHDFVPDAVKRREEIRKQLSKTHHLTYDFTFVWENWKKNQ